MNHTQQVNEINEAILAGQMALNSLNRAEKELSSAKRWGIVDMLGGGFLSSMIKHSKLDHAQEYMEEAKRNLRLFQKELRDIHVPMDFRIDVGNFLTFADYFFDGLIVDWMVQSRIGEAYEQIKDAIDQVNLLLDDLGRVHHTLALEMEE